MHFKFLTKGKRGKIYLSGDIATKKSLPRHVSNEVKWLKILNKKGIGPNLLSSTKDSFSYKFVKGPFLPEWIENQGIHPLTKPASRHKKEIQEMLKQVLLQCRIMDKLKINKLEMHNPYKHIVINSKTKPVLIDFERCYETKKPKNVTQFCQYLISGHLNPLLKSKGIILNRKDIILLTKQYKKTYKEQDFKKILQLL